MVDREPHTPKRVPFSEKLRLATSDREVQGLLDAIETNYIGGLLKKEGSPILSVSRLIRRHGYYTTPRNITSFAETLRYGGIPLGFIERPYRQEGVTTTVLKAYHFIALRHEQRAINCINGNHGLDGFKTNPVSVVCGPDPEHMPTTSDFKKHDGLVPTRPIFKKCGVNLAKAMVTGIASDTFFIDGCPVTIFAYIRRRFCRVEDVKRLEDYIQERLREIDS